MDNKNGQIEINIDHLLAIIGRQTVQIELLQQQIRELQAELEKTKPALSRKSNVIPEHN